MTLTKVLTAGALSVSLVLAQRGPGPGGSPPDPATMIEMRVGFLASSLALTDDQKAKATTIFTDAAAASQSIRTSERANRQANAAIYAMLTPDQQSKFDSIPHGGPGRGPGPGGAEAAGFRGRSRAQGGQPQQ